MVPIWYTDTQNIAPVYRLFSFTDLLESKRRSQTGEIGIHFYDGLLEFFFSINKGVWFIFGIGGGATFGQACQLSAMLPSEGAVFRVLLADGRGIALGPAGQHKAIVLAATDA